MIKALISEIDLEKGRIGLNTALLENSAGELIIDKQKVMQEASERALKTKALFDKKEFGLGVITNFKEKFSLGLEMEVLVIKEQNADGLSLIHI